MKPDELRALAKALEHMDLAPCKEAADYLRAQADAQPVAWLYRDWANVLKVSQLDPHEDGAFAVFAEPQPQAETQPAPAVPAGYKLVPVEPTPEMLQAGASIMDFDRSGWYDADVSRAEYRAMLAAAPATPQTNAKPVDFVAEARKEIASWPKWMQDAAKTAAATMPTTQTKPKREPLSDEQIDAALQTDPAMILALMSGEMTVGEFKLALRRLARTVERAYGIGGSDAE